MPLQAKELLTTVVNGAPCCCLLGTCRLNGVDLEHYLRHVLNVIADWPVNRVSELLTWSMALPAEEPVAPVNTAFAGRLYKKDQYPRILVKHLQRSISPEEGIRHASHRSASLDMLSIKNSACNLDAGKIGISHPCVTLHTNQE